MDSKPDITWEEYVKLIKEHQDPYDRWVHLAHMIDQYRIFPRIFITAYILLLGYSSFWFMALLAPTAAQTGFVSTIIGAGAAWFGLYVNSGFKRYDH